jgi:hopanoid C-3 methylase
VREWAVSVPEIVHLTVSTPYPGTETWYTDARKLTTLDYRLFDVQHAVLPTRLSLAQFYEELVKTQAVLSRKHLGFAALFGVGTIALRLLLQGQTNFLRMLWRFNQVYNPQRQYAEHFQAVPYTLSPQPLGHGAAKPPPTELYVHIPQGLQRRAARTMGETGR